MSRLLTDEEIHPDIDIRWRTVSLASSAHSEGGLTQLELAHVIAGETARLGARSDGRARDAENVDLPACDHPRASTRAPSHGRAIVRSRTAPRLPG